MTNVNVRDEIVIQALASGANQGEAARQAGISPRTVSNKMSSNAPEHVSFRSKLRARLAEIGLDESGTAQKLRELLDAKQYGLTKNGDVVEMGPDAHAQNKTLDMILKVTGSYPDPKLDVNATLAAQVVILGAADLPTGDPFSGFDAIDGEYSEVSE